MPWFSRSRDAGVWPSYGLGSAEAEYSIGWRMLRTDCRQHRLWKIFRYSNRALADFRRCAPVPE